MCNHLYTLHTYRHLELSKVRWRCGVCGRESSRPLDCCTPAYAARPQRPSVVQTLVRWLGGTAALVCTGVSTLLQRRRQPVDTPVGVVTMQPADDLPGWTETLDTEEVEETTRVSV